MFQLLVDLLPYLLALYAIDGVLRVPRHHLLIFSLWGGAFRVSRAPFVVAAATPASETFLTFEPPLYVTSTGVYVETPGVDARRLIPVSDELEFVSFGEGFSVEVDGREVRSAGRTLLEAPSAVLARETADLLVRLSGTPEKKRLALLARALRDSADPEVIAGRLAALRRRAAWLDGLGWALLAGLFGGLPLALARRQELLVEIWLGVVGLALIAALWLTHRTLLAAGAGDAERRGVLLSMLFLPAAAARANAHAGKDRLLGLHPLAVAAAVLDEEAFRDAARLELDRLSVARAAAEGTDLAAFWSSKADVAADIVSRAGLDPASLLAAPEAPDPLATAYCPLCRAEYREAGETCADCGVPLRALR